MSLKDRHAGKVVYASLAAAEQALGGHGRGTSSEEREPITRLPMIGAHPGAIDGTTPGQWLGQAQELERAGRDIVRARLHRRRFKPA